MTYFRIMPEIHKFEAYKTFSEDFAIGAGDFVLTHRFLYDRFMKELNCDAEFMFLEEYGTGEPSIEMINAMVKDQKADTYKRIFGIGGGSVMDVCKLMALTKTDDVADFFERKVPVVRDKELIIVPTTCGTGSEVTNISVALMASKGGKFGLQDDALYADFAVLIKELFIGLPYPVFISSSIDALIHAVEGFVSPRANPYSDTFAVKAIEMILRGYKDLVKHGQEYRSEIIDEFMMASNLAGIAFGNAGVGAVHALSFPLGGIYKVPHGEANYQFFIEVFKTYNRLDPNGKITTVNKILAEVLELDAKADVYEELGKLLNSLLGRKRLRDYGMKAQEIDTFTDDVLQFQQRLLKNNYVALSRADIHGIYQNLH